MDVGSLSRIFLPTIFISSLVACAPKQEAASVLEENSDACQAAAIKNQFLVKWTNGTITVHRADSTEQFLQEFVQKNVSQIEYVENDIRITLPPPPPSTSPRRMETTTTQADNWGDADANAAQAWAQGFYGSGVIVGVVDTGVDATHPQLINQIAYNPGESGLDAQGHPKSNNGIDDDANGIIDDYAGYQFALQNGQGVDAAQHGTHVSGIIAAQHHDTAVIVGPVQGIAPGVKILPAGFMDSNGGGSLSVALTAIDYAVAQGAKIINASWGGPVCSQALKDKVASLSAKNIAFVTAAGNSSNDIDLNPEFPASYNLPGQFTVGATGSMDLMADFSNYGMTDTHIFAPGVDIYSTIPGGGIMMMSGTSMSTPFISGAIAILMSVRPNATLDQIRQALYNSADYSSNYLNASHGRLNVGKAVQLIQSLVPATP